MAGGMKRRSLSFLVLSLIALASARCASVPTSSAPETEEISSGSASSEHVFVIMMENKTYDEAL